jgi:hypothetical protein
MLVEAAWQEFKMQMAEVEAWAGHGGCRNTLSRADGIKSPRFDGSVSWILYGLQFQVVADHNWAEWEKATHLLAVLQRQAI